MKMKTLFVRHLLFALAVLATMFVRADLPPLPHYPRALSHSSGVFQERMAPDSSSDAEPSQWNRFGGDNRGKHGNSSGARSVAFLIFIVILPFFALACLAIRRDSRKNACENIEDFQINVEDCLRTDYALRIIVTRRMLEEWALIIRFFATGKEPRRLCVPAVLFLWEKIFEPEMSHDEVIDLDKRIRKACGWDKVFSRKNFKSILAEVIKESGYEHAWSVWQNLGDYAYSISAYIGGSAASKVPPGFGPAVYRLLRVWSGRFDNITIRPLDWTGFFKAHREFAEIATLVLYGVLPAETIEELPFLHAGNGGASPGTMRKNQKKVELDAAGCNLYLPEGWNAGPESPGEGIAAMAGPRDREWLSVEHCHLSPEQAGGDPGAWVDRPRLFSASLPLHPPRCKADGVNFHVEVALEKFRRRDARFMIRHHADGMAAYSGTIGIEGRLHRVFIVILRRDADSWKFEYVFPAAEGVTKESLELHPDEIQAAARIFAPIEITKPVCCSLCGKKMDNSAGAAAEKRVRVLMKRRSLSGGQDLPESAVDLPWCETCRRNISDYGISKKILEEIPDVEARLAEGAWISEVKCGAVSVQLHCSKYHRRQASRQS